MKHGCCIIFLILLNTINLYANQPTNNDAIKTAFSKLLFCPTLDDDDLTVIPSTCNGSDGKILGMRGNGTGTLRFTWKDASSNIVGNNADLTDVAAGLYTVELADDSKCKAVISVQYRVGVKGEVMIDDKNVQINQPTCNNADGSITGITVSNAIQYQWINSSAKTVANTLDLTNVIADTYTLIATNAAGCSTEKNYTIPAITSVPQILTEDITDAACNSIGRVIVTFNLSATDPPYRYILQTTAAHMFKPVISSINLIHLPQSIL